jgi:hypothetical protein
MYVITGSVAKAVLRRVEAEEMRSEGKSVGRIWGKGTGRRMRGMTFAAAGYYWVCHSGPWIQERRLWILESAER